jgi:Zn finger protein HypA/HybF involved in hydrogenase expression
MGMTDESWCASCGTSLPYNENDVTCGSCVADTLEDFIAKFDKYLSDVL